ncbi:MAG: ferric reductase-like transmembrane domain-containing protein [Acidimicrobiia bacterium]
MTVPSFAALVAEADPKLAWYVARAGGLVGWVLLTASMLWGVALSSRVLRRKGIPAWLLDLHRFLGGLSVVFTGVHLAGLVADDYVAFGWKELFVPFASTWQPVAVAWGVVACYLLVAVEATSLLVRRLPRAWWRRVHTASFALFVTATIHGFAAGTDRTALAVRWTALSLSALLGMLIAVRVGRPRAARRRGPRAHRRPATAGAAADGVPAAR